MVSVLRGLQLRPSSLSPSGVVGPSSLGGVGFFFSFFLNVGCFEGNLDLAHFSLCILTQLEGGMFIV